MGRLKIVVLYDRVLIDEGDEAASGDKSPVVRTLDKKEVEEEVADALTKLGHEPVMYEIDGTIKSLLGLARVDCDLVFNLSESFGDDDTADFKIAAFLELLGRKYTGSGTHGLMLAQDKAIAKKIFAFHGIHTPTFAKSFRGRLDFSHDLQFPVIVKPAREAEQALDRAVDLVHDRFVTELGQRLGDFFLDLFLVERTDDGGFVAGGGFLVLVDEHTVE